MAKEGSGFAASVWKARRSALNSAAPFPGPEVAQGRVLGIQRKLHKWAEDDQDRRFKDLHNLVCDPATLMVAWQRVRANRGSRSAGVDGQTARYIERWAWRGSWARFARSCAPGASGRCRSRNG